MRHSALLPAFVASIVLLSACEEGPADEPAVMVLDSAGVTIVQNDLARLTATCPVGPEPNLVIGEPTRGPEHELFRVFGATRLGDGRIALVNQGSQDLRYYDDQGAFLASAGRAGEGPGEFRNAFYLWRLPGDTVWVGDYAPWQYHLFDPDGVWVRTVRPRPEYTSSPAVIQLLDDARAVLAPRDFSASGPGFQHREITVVVHGPEGGLLDTLGTYPNGRWGRVEDNPASPLLYPHFESFPRVAAGGSAIVTGHGSEPELNVYDAGADLRAPRWIVRWTTPSRTVSPADVAAERRRIDAQYADIDPAMRAQLVAPLLSEDRPTADRFPAFRSLVVGRDGRIWIREEPSLDAPDEHDWVAFSAEGRFECRARFPASAQLLELGADYLLVLDRDDLEIERVLGYRLGAAGEGTPHTQDR